MSSQKISTLWQRLKSLFISNKQAKTNHHEREVSSDISSHQSNGTTCLIPSSKRLSDELPPEQPNKTMQVKSQKDRQHRHKTPVFSHQTSTSKQTSATDGQLKFTTVSNVNQTEGMKQRSGVSKRSKQPITNAILAFLDDNELSYHYHDSIDSQNNHPSTQEPSPASPVKEASDTNQDSDKDYSSNVHHISMAMRYYIDTDLQSEQVDSERVLNAIQKDIEWGCVIRIHEHTQLLAIYGILPFKLPTTHLEAGITLATQLNYDMMLGNVEIDIRDGEIRFKNALDLEPILTASGGIIQPPIINFLLKSVMAMTTSFEPIFRELIKGDAQKFELQNLLAQIDEALQKQTFFIASETLQ